MKMIGYITFFFVIVLSYGYGQVPEGGICFVLFDSLSNQVTFPEVSFIKQEQKPELYDATGKYRVQAFDKTRSRNNPSYVGTQKDSLFGSRFKNVPYFSTGFGGDFQLVITHEKDTMIVNFINVCNHGFGLKISFRKGEYDILVCDTTKIPDENTIEGWHFRPIEEQYSDRFLGLYDLTSKLIRRKKEKK